MPRLNRFCGGHYVVSFPTEIYCNTLTQNLTLDSDTSRPIKINQYKIFSKIKDKKMRLYHVS